jgi:hypothetical protein
LLRPILEQFSNFFNGHTHQLLSARSSTCSYQLPGREELERRYRLDFPSTRQQQNTWPSGLFQGFFVWVRLSLIPMVVLVVGLLTSGGVTPSHRLSLVWLNHYRPPVKAAKIAARTQSLWRLMIIVRNLVHRVRPRSNNISSKMTCMVIHK